MQPYDCRRADWLRTRPVSILCVPSIQSWFILSLLLCLNAKEARAFLSANEEHFWVHTGQRAILVPSKAEFVSAQYISCLPSSSRHASVSVLTCGAH